MGVPNIRESRSNNSHHRGQICRHAVPAHQSHELPGTDRVIGRGRGEFGHREFLALGDQVAFVRFNLVTIAAAAGKKNHGRDDKTEDEEENEDEGDFDAAVHSKALPNQTLVPAPVQVETPTAETVQHGPIGRGAAVTRRGTSRSGFGLPVALEESRAA
jgi:hypothetical protein